MAKNPAKSLEQKNACVTLCTYCRVANDLSDLVSKSSCLSSRESVLKIVPHAACGTGAVKSSIFWHPSHACVIFKDRIIEDTGVRTGIPAQ